MSTAVQQPKISNLNEFIHDLFYQEPLSDFGRGYNEALAKVQSELAEREQRLLAALKAQPRIESSATLEYPLELRARRINGPTLVFIDTDGHLVQLRLNNEQVQVIVDDWNTEAFLKSPILSDEVVNELSGPRADLSTSQHP